MGVCGFLDRFHLVHWEKLACGRFVCLTIPGRHPRADLRSSKRAPARVCRTSAPLPPAKGATFASCFGGALMRRKSNKLQDGDALRVILSRITASSTIAIPASTPIPTCTELSARTTGTPSPPAPTSAAMTTMDRLNMMHWVVPARISGAALGSSTLNSSCQRVAPKASPARAVRAERWRPELGHSDRRRQRENHRRNQRRYNPKTKQHQGRNQVYECRQSLHQVESRAQRSRERGTMRGCDPTGTPIAVAASVETRTSESVSSVCCQYP